MELDLKATKQHRRRSLSSAAGLLNLRKLRKRDETLEASDEGEDELPSASLGPVCSVSPSETPEREQEAPPTPDTEGEIPLRILPTVRSNSLNSRRGRKLSNSKTKIDPSAFRSSMKTPRFEMFGRPLPYVISITDPALRHAHQVHFSTAAPSTSKEDLHVPMIVQCTIARLRAVPGLFLYHM